MWKWCTPASSPTGTRWQLSIEYNPAVAPHFDIGALLRSIRRVLGSILLVAAVLAGIGGAVVAQAGREETTSADTAILMLDGTEGARAARLDHAVRLYLAGQISRVLVVGADTTGARDTLVARGVVQDKIAEVRESTEIGQIEHVRDVLREARITDAMLVGEPVQALRLLKIARDRGLELRSAPKGVDTALSIGNVVDEVGRYLVYCFAGR